VKEYNLTNLEEISNSGYCQVYSGLRGGNPVILKVSQDSLANEVKALQSFSGLGAVKIIASEEKMI